MLLRQDPPFDMAYITTTHLLERIHPKTLVVNDPASVRNAPEKLFVTEFPELMPPTLITPRPRRASPPSAPEHGDIIVKPLYGNGGAGVFRIAGDDANLGCAARDVRGRLPRALRRRSATCRRCAQGDKRIILVDGEPVGAINRVPAAGEARSNMHVGGRAGADRADRARPRDLRRDRPGAAAQRGLIFVGIDVIGDYLTEINVTSPTGIREVKRFGGADIAGASGTRSRRSAKGLMSGRLTTIGFDADDTLWQNEHF